MQIINKAFLKLALLPSGLYHKMGVQLPQLRSILQTKLTMDDRRPNTVQQTSRKKSSRPVSRATIGTMIVSALLGLVYLLSFVVGQDKVTQLTVYFSFFFFMLSATLISDFTSVLIDVRDTYIILPRPVNDSTVIVARMLHIFIHICKIVLPMSVPGLVKIFIDDGAGGAFLFLLMIFLLTLFAIFFINSVYIIILKITTPEKFQTIISYVQIIFAIVMYGSYQIFPRLVDQFDLEHFNIASIRGIGFYPIYWFANTWKVFYSFHGSSAQLVLAGLGFILPVLSIYTVVRYLAPSFNNKLALINNAAGNQQHPVSAKSGGRSSYADFLSRVFTRGNAERMGFLFTWKMTARSRDFRMKVYPSIGYLLVYVVIMFMRNKHLSISEIAAQQSAGKLIIISALYFTSLLLTMAINQIVYSEKYKASWIYYVSPLAEPGAVILGSAKAAIFKFYIPLVAFITVAGIVIAGPSILPNIVLGLFNELLIATILVYAGHKMFPFSMHQNTSVKTGSLLRNLFVLFISGMIALGHFVIYDYMPAVILCAALSILATWLLMTSVRRTSWEAIKSSYTED
ncbi:MAG TPA: hypothetical protein VNR87_06830 [Flavisolibacter sp.]|nr:hypothetical protein [Flavisolibacter sp.]